MNLCFITSNKVTISNEGSGTYFPRPLLYKWVKWVSIIILPLFYPSSWFLSLFIDWFPLICHVPQSEHCSAVPCIKIPSLAYSSHFWKHPLIDSHELLLIAAFLRNLYGFFHQVFSTESEAHSVISFEYQQLFWRPLMLPN